MDSPVIVDTGSKFGREIDLDHSFRGFPFDDEEEDNFGRRSDIRSHLDDLAARHPELSEHLSIPGWLDNRFQHGGARNHRRRDSGSGSSYQGHPDEDARSQASGSSAASGASGVSSHDESDLRSSRAEDKSRRRQQPIPQYGLRNTVDIGQHRHDMENKDSRDIRNQRSMSAPPENRQQNEQDQQQQPNQGHRFVSRVDITPQHNLKQQQQTTGPPPSPQQQQQQHNQQQQANVRHIPIFVEGRDEPVIPKNFDESPHFPRQPSPPSFNRQQSPPPSQFPRRTPFTNNWHNNRSQWPPQFADNFYQPQSSFEQPSTQRYHEPKGFKPQTQSPRQQQVPVQKAHQQQVPVQKPQQQPHRQQQQPHKQQQQPQQNAHFEQQQQQQQEQELPKPKPLPKDPLERVALVQQEVDSLAAQVKEYTGNSRTDKQYIYLDEMLTRELIKLDDIETEGRENVRQARKNAIKTIQNTISLLESKALLPKQQCESEEPGDQDKPLQSDLEAKNLDEQLGQTNGGESMETDQTEEKALKEPIPLPPAPSNPDNNIALGDGTQEDAPVEQNETVQIVTKAEDERLDPANQTCQDSTPDVPTPQDLDKNEQRDEKRDSSETQPADEGSQLESTDKQLQPGEEQEKQKDHAEVTSQDNVEAKTTEVMATVEPTQQRSNSPSKEEQRGEVMDVEKPPTTATCSPKMSKKVKKMKEQTCVSQEPIPLPPPTQNS